MAIVVSCARQMELFQVPTGGCGYGPPIRRGHESQWDGKQTRENACVSAPPSSLDLHGAHPQRKKLAAPEINLSLDQSEGSILSDDALDTPDDLDINVDDLDTPDEADSLEYTGHGNELEWEAEASRQDGAGESIEAIPEYTTEEERQDTKLWRTVIIGEQEHRIDMKCIEPYQKVISHGGYYGDLNAIIVFAACFLPDSNRDNYHYVMENLFLSLKNDMNLFTFIIQAQEESEILHYSTPILVYQNHPSCHQTFHQVSMGKAPILAKLIFNLTVCKVLNCKAIQND
ncbi:hypothetical protein Z043_113286 [Scleropages formosus]|uniref:Prune homolog 2 with BCH domain n=1 Tax=Scleropages formosus TaxID=113540 RepID=A0A0P7X1M9_SCLFO|nr:hypothetical protein Z043_113286 [Scleropages formosus]